MDTFSTHLFLKGKEKGINKVLRGNVAFCYILVDVGNMCWTTADEEKAVRTIRETSSWFMQEAKKRNIRLHIRNFVFHGYREQQVDIKTNGDWTADVMRPMKYSSILSLRNAFKDGKGFDDVAILFLFRYEERSFASQQVNVGDGVEYATLFYEATCNTFVHEICHLYGACDFYYSPEVTEKVKRYLGGSVMDTNALYIDDVTAYTIGWTHALSKNARYFLEETAHITASEWAQAARAQTKSGPETFRYRDGSSYAGDMKNGVAHGNGILRYAVGHVYKGQFRNGQPEGSGIFTFTTGDR